MAQDWFEKNKPDQKATGDWFADNAPTTETPAQAKPLDPKSKGYTALKAITAAMGPQYAAAFEAAIGGAKGAGSTAYNVGRMIPGVRGMLPEQKPAMLQPEGTAQKAGYGAEQVGEFFLPGGAVKRGMTGIQAATKTLGPKVAAMLNLGGRGALEAASAGGVTMAQTGGDTQASMRNAAIAGAIPLAVVPALKTVAGPVARKIESVVLRPTAADYRNGFKIQNVFKYDVGGNLQQTAEKTHKQITQRVDELRTLLKSKPVDVDVIDALMDAATELKANPSKTMGLNSKIDKALDFWLEELQQIAPTGKVSLADSNEMKRSIGKFGAWISGARDPESGALEKVSNAFYTKLRLAIEKAGNDPAIHALNREIGDMIPIEQAVIRRLPVDARNAVMSLTDALVLSGSIINPANLWLFAAKKATTSGRVASGLYKAGTKADAVGGGAARVITGMANQPKD